MTRRGVGHLAGLRCAVGFRSKEGVLVSGQCIQCCWSMPPFTTNENPFRNVHTLVFGWVKEGSAAPPPGNTRSPTPQQDHFRGTTAPSCGHGLSSGVAPTQTSQQTQATTARPTRRRKSAVAHRATTFKDSAPPTLNGTIFAAPPHHLAVAGDPRKWGSP